MKRILTVALCAVMTVASAFAQSKEFKSQWKQLQGPVYFTLASLAPKAKLPSGETTFKVYGFRDDFSYPADITLSGNVVNATEQDKFYAFDLDKGDVVLKNDDLHIKFTGDYRMDCYVNKQTKRQIMRLYFVDGTLTFNGDVHLIHKAWSDNLGYIELGFDEKYKAQPPVICDKGDFHLPKKSYRAATPSRQLYDDLIRGTVKLTPADSLFLASVTTDRSNIIRMPGYREHISEVESIERPGQIAATEVIGHDLGNEIELDDLTATRNGDEITIQTKYGRNGWEQAKARFSTYDRDPKFIAIDWGNGARYEGEMLTRDDESRLYGVYFDHHFIDKNRAIRGYIPMLLKVLQDLSRAENYDFGDYVDSYGLVINAYTDPNSNRRVVLTDGLIAPIAERMYLQMQDEARRQNELQKKKDAAAQAYRNQQQLLSELYRDDLAAVKMCDAQNTQSQRPYQITLVRYINYLPSQNAYTVVYKVVDKGSEFDIECDEDGDFFYGSGNAKVYLKGLDARYMNELQDWILIKQYNGR